MEIPDSNGEKEVQEREAKEVADLLRQENIVGEAFLLAQAADAKERSGSSAYGKDSLVTLTRSIQNLDSVFQSQDNLYRELERTLYALFISFSYSIVPGAEDRDLDKFRAGELGFADTETADTIRAFIPRLAAVQNIFTAVRETADRLSGYGGEMGRDSLANSIRLCEKVCEEKIAWLNTVAENSYLALTYRGIKEKREEVLDSIRRTMTAERKSSDEILGELSGLSRPLSYSKKDLARDEWRKGIDSDDPIEIQIKRISLPSPHEPGISVEERGERTEKQRAETGNNVPYFRFSFRNKRIAQMSPRTEYRGVFGPGTPDELQAFIDEMDAIPFSQIGVGGIGDAKSSMSYLRNEATNQDKRLRLFVMKSPDNRVVGVALMNDVTHRSGTLGNIIVAPQFQDQGVGRAMLSGLKNEFDSIHLSAVTHTRHPIISPEVFQSKLVKFYKHNGFCHASNWSRSQINLDDENRAGQWQESPKSDLSGVIIDDATLSFRDTMNGLYASILEHPETEPEIKPEVLEKLRQWKALYGKRIQAQNDLDEISKALRLKSINEKHD